MVDFTTMPSNVYSEAWDQWALQQSEICGPHEFMKQWRLYQVANNL